MPLNLRPAFTLQPARPHHRAHAEHTSPDDIAAASVREARRAGRPTVTLLVGGVSVAALAVAVFALIAWQFSPSAFAAQCASSTPTSVTYPDAANDTRNADGTPSATNWAPDFTAVHVMVDSGCAMTLSYNLNRPSGEDWLFGRESVGVFVDTDGNAGTGEAGFDRALITIGDSYGAEHSQLASWNGTDWVTQDIPAIPGSGGAQRLTFDALGISASTTVNVRAISNYSHPSGPDRDGFDFAPEQGAVGVPVAFTGPVAPPPPPPPPAKCKVPKVRGFKLAKAKKTLSAAGCRAKVVQARSRNVRRGRVIKTSPRAGRTTSGEVKVTVSRGRR
jgi:PASTA domain